MFQYGGINENNQANFPLGERSLQDGMPRSHTLRKERSAKFVASGDLSTEAAKSMRVQKVLGVSVFLLRGADRTPHTCVVELGIEVGGRWLSHMLYVNDSG